MFCHHSKALFSSREQRSGSCLEKPDDSSWTSTTGLTSEADCNAKAWRCNAGYDNQENSQCSATIAKYYSLAGSNDRVACPGKPDDSSWTSTGLTSEADCNAKAWRCNAGYDNQETSSQCSATIAKHYSWEQCPGSVSGSRMIRVDKHDRAYLGGGLKAWRCDAGYDNQGDQQSVFCHHSKALFSRWEQCP